MFRGCRVWSLGFGVLGLEGFRAFMVGSGRDRSSYGFVSDVKLTEMTNTHREGNASTGTCRPCQ